MHACDTYDIHLGHGINENDGCQHDEESKSRGFPNVKECTLQIHE